ncbi:MAG: hypothetical protein CMB80_00990 [Flammeovirgaceae bacterium]|nr:hypothetical protein [Flammeovirgaceae bacterium]|tara:strand:- start:2003 stop:2191 length:189 start_codon:yes stop_codon:yes gene_type:complete
MFIKDLIEKHGTGIKVSCGKPNYPPFTVLDALPDDTYRIKYDNGEIDIITGCINDYDLIKES